MATGLGNYQPIEAEDLLAQLSDSNEETDDSDDSFDTLMAGIDTGQLDKVSFIYESNDNGNNGSNEDKDNWLVAGSVGHYDPSLPGLCSDDDSGDSSDFSVSSSGEEKTRTKHSRKPAKKWKKGSKFVLKMIKVFDNLNAGIQVPYKLPVDAKEVEYFKTLL